PWLSSSLRRWESRRSEMPSISARYSPKRRAPWTAATRMEPVQRRPTTSRVSCKRGQLSSSIEPRSRCRGTSSPLIHLPMVSSLCHVPGCTGTRLHRLLPHIRHDSRARDGRRRPQHGATRGTGAGAPGLGAEGRPVGAADARPREARPIAGAGGGGGGPVSCAPQTYWSWLFGEMISKVRARVLPAAQRRSLDELTHDLILSAGDT